MKLILSLAMMILSSMMIFLNNPLSMGFMILMQTLLLCIMMGMIIETYWFSYILFLTFLGGLLVLFIYVSSIASNEMFKFKNKLKLYFFMLILLSLIILIIYHNNLYWMNFFNNKEISNFNVMSMMNNNENTFNLNKLYNNHTFLMMMMMMIYLFITLVAVVKITNIFYGPLRSNF